VDAIRERAREVGRLLAQSDEYKSLRRANDRLSEDRESVELLNRLSALEQDITAGLQRDVEPTQEQQDEYEGLAERLQQKSAYQGLVSAQSNFDRLMIRVNEEIAEGIKAGEQSRIILP
jgi:cell fate (sporulation/competence/biofilm development) regulator YlbF (YheA/YmcA/DUF963 family)